MSFIKAEKISYSYPVIEDDEEFDSKKKKAEDEPKQPEKKMGENALKEVTLEVKQGQFLCILGRNGSGKSTFAKHLNALLLPSEGTLWVDGIDTKEEDQVWTIRKNVGMVFQNPDNQIIGSVVDEDVAFGLENLGIPSEQIQKDVASALEGVGMTDYAKYSPNKLSGGQKQRVAVAGVLAMAPKCIVLDESTAMLDPRGRREVMETVKRLNKEMGITIISITHFMEETLDADYIYVMHKGKVALQGTPKEIFSRGTELYSLGLWFPQIYHLAYVLREKGLPIPDDVIHADELKAALENLKKK
ncbi:MAG: energy-coupling factor transporter ATPase [Lachnospiraceae bacterium]|nr:energy-coupling factor transporter ATPase [Lachnospiraceae bacterium]